MDYPFDIAVKVEKDELEPEDNGNIQEFLFDVEIKVEKEVSSNCESDWCVTSLDNSGHLLEPLFFKQMTENFPQKCAHCHKYFSDDFSILKHNLDHLHVVISKPIVFQRDCSDTNFIDKTDKHTMNNFTDKIDKQTMNRHIPLPECHTVNLPKLCENPGKTLTLKYKPKAYVPGTTDVTLKVLQDGLTNSLNYRSKTCKSRPKSKQLHECKICNKMYTYTHWHAHMSEVHGDGGFYCGLCKLEFKCERYFMKHMRKKHHERFDAQKNMPDKKQEIKGYDKIKVKCDVCDKVLQSLYALKTHKRNVHSNEKYVCSICKSTLKCKSYLLSHMRRVHYNDGKTHSCECGKSFKSPRYLAVHKKNAHQRKNKNVLSICAIDVVIRTTSM